MKPYIGSLFGCCLSRDTAPGAGERAGPQVGVGRRAHGQVPIVQVEAARRAAPRILPQTRPGGTRVSPVVVPCAHGPPGPRPYAQVRSDDEDDDMWLFAVGVGVGGEVFRAGPELVASPHSRRDRILVECPA